MDFFHTFCCVISFAGWKYSIPTKQELVQVEITLSFYQSPKLNIEMSYILLIIEKEKTIIFMYVFKSKVSNQNILKGLQKVAFKNW